MKDFDLLLLETAYDTVLKNAVEREARVPEPKTQPIVESFAKPEEIESKEITEEDVLTAYTEAIKNIRNKKLISENNIKIISSDKKFVKKLTHNLVLFGREIPTVLKESLS
jgi:hypothetical protein